MTPPRPLPLPRTLPDAPISEWGTGYLIALRYRLVQHIRWREECCTEPDDLDTDCLPCHDTEDP